MTQASKIQISDTILLMDDFILLVNKPAGMLTIRDGYNPNLPYLAQILANEFGPVWVVHRLDRDTSGILILARTAQAHQNLSLQFEHHLIKKTYHAIATGVPDREHFIIERPLKVDGDRRHRTIVDEQNGKNATTEFLVLENYKKYCLIEARPTTGYTHQIRVHLLAAGYPILSDSLYQLKVKDSPGAPGSNTSIQEGSLIHRMALHARSITFTHPLTGQLIEIEAPYPDDFANAINHLRQQN
ncbi:MAG TPA: RluA family pseudouridine synthase [Anaerolineaceae bacterium]|nr:RluA family pseudouridine synthase [Anaerolineaceae bacterium]